MPICTGCKSEKDITDFYVRPSRKKGHYSKCKTCYDAANVESSRRNSAKYRATKKAFVIEHLGSSCYFCGYEDRIAIHRKDGVPHKPFHFMGRNEWETHIQSGEYVRLCFHCHKAVHWCVTHLGLSWIQITGMMPSG